MLLTPIKKCIDRKIEKKRKSSTSKEWAEEARLAKEFICQANLVT